MKILMIGISGAQPEILLGEEGLENLRRLMEMGCYGRLVGGEMANMNEAWLLLLSSLPVDQFPALSLDTFSIGLLQSDNNICQWIWTPVRDHGKQVHILASQEVPQPGDSQLTDSALAASQSAFSQVRAQMQSNEWGFVLFIDQALGSLHQAEFAGHLTHESVKSYYFHLDALVGTLLELLDDETLVLIVSPNNRSSKNVMNGCFILASPNNPLSGEISGVTLTEIAPTVLELSGYEIPQLMQGKSIIAGKALDRLTWGDLSAEEEEILRERLSGLGYIS